MSVQQNFPKSAPVASVPAFPHEEFVAQWADRQLNEARAVLEDAAQMRNSIMPPTADSLLEFADRVALAGELFKQAAFLYKYAEQKAQSPCLPECPECGYPNPAQSGKYRRY